MQPQPTFQWIQCSFFLKKNVEGSQTTINLTPTYKLQFVNKAIQTTDVNFELSVATDKPFLYTEQLGFSWHKSWALPVITLTLTTHTQDTSVLLQARNLYAQICAVRPVVSKEYSLCIEQVGLEGVCKLPIKNGQCVFSGLRFQDTSFNCQGSGFHLLIVLCGGSTQEEGESRIILNRISSPIFVDSRRTSHKIQHIKLRKLNSFIEPFEVRLLRAEFIKRQSKKAGICIEQKIGNDAAGLVNYFSAANIRNKVKHPLFLAAKFNRCVSIYYRRSLIEDSSSRSIITLLQKILYKMFGNLAADKSSDTNPKNKLLLIVVKTPPVILSNHQKNLISEYGYVPQFLEPLNNEQVLCMSDQKQIPSTFQKIQIDDQLLQVYGGLYDGLHTEYQTLLQLKMNALNKQPGTKERGRKQGNSTTKAPVVEQEKIKPQPHIQSSEQQSQSVSSQPSQMQRPDVALNCQITLHPIRKKPMKLGDFLRLQTQFPNKIECQRRDYSQMELKMLCTLMHSQIAERSQRIKYLQATKAQFLINKHQ